MSKPTSRLLRTSWQFCVDTSSLIFIKNPDEDFVINVSIPARSVTVLAMFKSLPCVTLQLFRVHVVSVSELSELRSNVFTPRRPDSN